MLRSLSKVSPLALLLAAFALPGCSAGECTDSTFADPQPLPPSASGNSAPSYGGATSSNQGGAGSASSGAASAARAISEADIVQVQDGKLYAMSKSGTVSVVDVSVPGSLKMLGQATIPGQPFEMYLRGTVIVAMTDGAIGTDGTPLPASSTNSNDASGSTSTTSTPPSTTDSSFGAAIIAIDATDPTSMKQSAVHSVPGAMADSRVVGNILYLATYENATCFGCGAKPRTMVTSFDITDPNNALQIDQASFESNAPDSFNLPWGSAWKRSILANDQRLYIGGHADVDPADFPTDGTSSVKEGIIDVLDITDPSGKLGKGAHLTIPGAILSRWQMDESNGVLRIISQTGAGRTGNGVAMPEVDTFTIADTQTFTPLGSTTLKLPMQEGLRTVRFDTNRAYAITYNQTDPLFTIDLADPAAPKQRGALSMPGFMFYLEPHGDRIVGLGVDRTDPNGSMNVSLFDVSDMDAPKMIKRVAFGSSGLSEDFTILNLELPEDQDRIAKAFKVFPDGIVAVPFSGANAMYDSTTGCTNPQSGVQLVSWQNDTLAAKALLPMVGNPRRAIELTSEMLAVSDSNVTAFSIESASYGKKEADLTIGTCVDKSVPNQGAGGGGVNEGDQGGGYGYPADGYGGQGYDQAQSEPSSGSSGCGSVTLSKIGAAIASLRTSRR